MTFVSYAQNFEDVLLWRALRDVEHGQYLDIGAQDPLLDSVSRAFYEAGWRGVHVEPTSDCARRLREARPEETVIEAAVTDAPGPIPFYELGGLSSGRKDVAKRHEESGHRPQKILVPTVRLENLLTLFDGEIHWLKIDVEGMEADVLRSWRKSAIRPWVLIVESTYPNSEELTQHLWLDEVLKRGYHEAFFDGLSRYFVHELHAELAERLNRPANVFDAYQITLDHFSAKNVRDQALSLQQASDANDARQAAVILDQRDRIRVATVDLDQQKAEYSSLESRSAAEIEDTRAKVEIAERSLAAQLARLDEMTALQREGAMEIGRLDNDLGAERAARIGLDAEMTEIARLADADLANLPDFHGVLRSVPSGLAYTAVKSRLQLAAKEQDLLRDHAERQHAAGHREQERLRDDVGRQFAAGHAAREGEVSFLNQRLAALQADVSDACGRLAQFEAAYAAARDRSEAADKENARFGLALDEQAKALDVVAADAAAVSHQLVDARAHIDTIYRSRGGKFATLIGLLPKMFDAPPRPTQSTTSIDARRSFDDADHSPDPKMEIAVNDVRHVAPLLTLNGTAFVDALYRAFLKRAPDRAGRDHFLGRLQAGHGKEAILLAVATSTEAQAIGAPIEGIAELQRAQASVGGGWNSKRDRAFDRRLNRLEHMMGEAHNRLFDRLDDIQNSVAQIQGAISAGAGFRADAGASLSDANARARQSIKQGVSIAPQASATEFIDTLKREVQSSSEALSLRRS